MRKEGNIVLAVQALIFEIISAKNSNPMLQPWLEQVLRRWDENRGCDDFENYIRKKQEEA